MLGLSRLRFRVLGLGFRLFRNFGLRLFRVWVLGLGVRLCWKFWAQAVNLGFGSRVSAVEAVSETLGLGPWA